MKKIDELTDEKFLEFEKLNEVIRAVNELGERVEDLDTTIKQKMEEEKLERFRDFEKK